MTLMALKAHFISTLPHTQAPPHTRTLTHTPHIAAAHRRLAHLSNSARTTTNNLQIQITVAADTF